VKQQRGEVTEREREKCSGKKWYRNTYSLNITNLRAEVVDHLSIKCNVLSSNPIPHFNKKQCVNVSNLAVK
jgi:hypothetical protein